MISIHLLVTLQPIKRWYQAERYQLKKNNNPTWIVDMKFINKMQTWENVLDYTRDQKQTLTLNINSISCYHDSCPDKKVLSVPKLEWIKRKYCQIAIMCDTHTNVHTRTQAMYSWTQTSTSKETKQRVSLLLKMGVAGWGTYFESETEDCVIIPYGDYTNKFFIDRYVFIVVNIVFSILHTILLYQKEGWETEISFYNRQRQHRLLCVSFILRGSGSLIM